MDERVLRQKGSLVTSVRMCVLLLGFRVRYHLCAIDSDISLGILLKMLTTWLAPWHINTQPDIEVLLILGS